MTQQPRILIAENLPAFNKGEIAIAYGLLRALEMEGRPCKLQMLSFHPEYDRARYDSRVEIVDFRDAWPMVRDAGSGRRLWPALSVFLLHLLFAVMARLLGKGALAFWRAPLWRAYLEADLIVFGHDSSFGIGGDPENPFFYPVYIPHIVRLMGKRVMFVAGTIPTPPVRFRGLIGRLYGAAVAATHATTLREEGSYAKLKAFGGRMDHVQVTADPAYVMEAASPARVDEMFRADGVPEGPLVGMTVSAIRARVSRPGSPDEAYASHVREMAVIADAVIEATGATIVFLPHVIGHEGEGDDRSVAREIRALCRHAGKIVLVETEYSPIELKGMVGRCRLIIGERLHSIIAAASQGIAAIVISYRQDPRLGMVRPVVTDEFICAIEALDTAEMLQKVLKLWNEGPAESQARAERAAGMRRKSLVNARVLLGLLENRA